MRLNKFTWLIFMRRFYFQIFNFRSSKLVRRVAAGVAISWISSEASAAVYWTVEIKGIVSTNAGLVEINIEDQVPSSPNPSGTDWISCKNNWIVLSKMVDGTAVEGQYVSQMLSVALGAFKTNSKIRVSIDRDSSNNCYTSQIFDLGK